VPGVRHGDAAQPEGAAGREGSEKVAHPDELESIEDHPARGGWSDGEIGHRGER